MGREGGRHAGGPAIATRRAAHSSRETSRTARDGRRGTDTASTQPIHLLTASPDQHHRDEPPEARRCRPHRHAHQRADQAHRACRCDPGVAPPLGQVARRNDEGRGFRPLPSSRGSLSFRCNSTVAAMQLHCLSDATPLFLACDFHCLWSATRHQLQPEVVPHELHT